MERSSLMMPECAGMARGRTLQTVAGTCIFHGDSSFMISLCVQPGIPPLLWVGVAGWIGTNLCFSSLFFSLNAWIFFLPLETSATQPGYGGVGRKSCSDTAVCLCADRTLLSTWASPHTCGTWKLVKDLKVITNGGNSPVPSSLCAV